MASPHPITPEDLAQNPTHAQHHQQDEELRQALASFGLLPPEMAEGPHAGGEKPQTELWLWPENRPAWDLWLAVQTQWRVGMAGATGLDYSAVAAVMHLQGVPRQERAGLLALLRVLEGEALGYWASKAGGRPPGG